MAIRLNPATCGNGRWTPNQQSHKIGLIYFVSDAESDRNVNMSSDLRDHQLRLPLYLWALSCILLISPTALADETTEITQTQRDLNARGVAAISDGDYERAIRLLQSSLDVGELNVTHANLGRSYQHAGRCKEAEQHFVKALDAPPVKEPSRRAIADAIAGYRAEMERECPGYLDVECEPAEIDLYIDNDGQETCHQDQRELAPGQYDLRGEYEGNISETTVAIEALQTSRVRLSLTGARVDEAMGQGIAQVEHPSSESFASPWVWLTAGSATLVGGVAMDNLPSQAGNGELNAINVVPIALYTASAGLFYLGFRALRR